MSDDIVSVAITADVSGLKAGMSEAASATTQSTQLMRDSLGRFVSSSAAAKTAADGLGESLGGLKGPLAETSRETEHAGGAMEEFVHHVRGMRQEAFLGNFMARQIAEVGFASQSAAAEVTGFISAFAIGGGLGVAIESVKMLAKFFNEGDEAVKKIQEDGEKSLEALKGKVADIMLTLSGATKAQTLAAKELREQEDARAKLVERLAEVQEKYTAATERYTKAANAEKAQAALRASEEQAAAAKEIDDINRQIAAIDKLAAAKKEAIAPAVAGLNTADTKAALDKQAIDEATWRADQMKDWKKYYDDQTALTLKAMEEQAAADKKSADDKSRWIGQVLKLEIEAAKKIDELNKHNDEERVARQKRLEKYNQDEAKSFLKDFVRPVESAFSSSIKGMLLQGESFADGLKGFFVSLAGAAIDGFIKMGVQFVESQLVAAAAAKVSNVSETQGNIAVAVSGAAASQAAIPIVGPLLAIGSATTMETTLEGMTAPLLSARGGLAEVPYDGTWTTLHAKEMVWPAEYSTGARNMLSSFADGDGAGFGQTIQVIIQPKPFTTVDYTDIYEGLTHPSTQRAISMAKRNGRWP